jgi:hypothetical protein
MTTPDNTLDDYAEIIIQIKRITNELEKSLTNGKVKDAGVNRQSLNALIICLNGWFERNVK